MLKVLDRLSLCCGCGACEAVCPNDAIKISLQPKHWTVEVNDRCSGCSLYSDICPMRRLKERISAKHRPGQAYVEGTIRDVLICYARDRELRRDASSGGGVTGVLCALIRSGEINGAVVTRASLSNPVANESIVAQTEEDVVACKGSRYSPASACQALKSLKEFKHGRYAFVGKPCEVSAARACAKRLPWLQKRITLFISIFCHHSPSMEALEKSLRALGIKPSDVSSISYRGSGWPGLVRIQTMKDNKEITLPYRRFWDECLGHRIDFLSCLLCDDFFGREADLSFGDPWNDEASEDELGKSLVIVRSSEGEQAMARAEAEGMLFIDKPCIEGIWAHQPGLRRKLDDIEQAWECFRFVRALMFLRLKEVTPLLRRPKLLRKMIGIFHRICRGRV